MRNSPSMYTKVQWTNAKHFRPKWQSWPDAVGSPSLLINFLYVSEGLIIGSTVRNSVVPCRCTRKDGSILSNMNIKERRLQKKRKSYRLINVKQGKRSEGKERNSRRSLMFLRPSRTATDIIKLSKY